MKPTYFSYVDQHPFHGLPHENPLDHIETLEEFFWASKSKDYIICKLFKYFLFGNAVSWLKRLPLGSLIIWSDVRSALR